MTRISISVPDSLIARLEPIKDSINISQLCREALEQRVGAFEWAADRGGDDPDSESLVLRLREEREVFEGRFELLGREGAAAWLNFASYPDVKSVTDNHAPPSMLKYRLPRAAFKVLKHDMEEAKLDCEGPHAVVYKTAWLDHVRAVWTQIVDGHEAINHPEPEEAQEEISD